MGTRCRGKPSCYRQGLPHFQGLCGYCHEALSKLKKTQPAKAQQLTADLFKQPAGLLNQPASPPAREPDRTPRQRSYIPWNAGLSQDEIDDILTRHKRRLATAQGAA